MSAGPTGPGVPSSMSDADAANGEPGASGPLRDRSGPNPSTGPAWERRPAGTGPGESSEDGDGGDEEDQTMAGTPTDALEQLEHEHRAVEQLLGELADSEPGSRRAQLVDELTTALEDHMDFEERRLYPVVREVLGGEDAEEAEIEHDLTRDGLGKLGKLVDEPGFGAAVAMVRAGVGHHVEEEEGEMFPRLRREAAEAVGELRRGPAGAGNGDRADGRGPDGSDDGGPTRDELYRAAQEADVPGRSSMTKDELARALED